MVNSKEIFYENLLKDSKLLKIETSAEVIIVDPKTEYENMMKQDKVFFEADESGFINPLICK